MIPVLSFYMFLREMKAVPPASAPVTDRWPGVLSSRSRSCRALGNLVAIDDMVFYGLIIWIYGLVLTGFGLRRGWVFWPSVLHLVLMLPLPHFLYWKVTPRCSSSPRKSASAGAADRGAGLSRRQRHRPRHLQAPVAEACSGLRYLFPIMSFSYVFAVLYRGPVWHKLVLLLAAVPLAVLMNSVRIGIIGILVDRYGIGQAEGFLHFFEGWVIFLSCIGILFLLAMASCSGFPRPPAARRGDRPRLLRPRGAAARVLAIAPAPALIAAAC